MAAGLVATTAEAQAWLDDDGVAAAVDAEEKAAHDSAISAVPSYVVNGRFRVGGCQESSVFLELFDKILAAESTAAAAAAAQ